MLQSDYNTHPNQCILYYIYQQGDTTVYAENLSNVCQIYYDISGNIAITNWLIGGFGPPSTGTILGYTLSAVLTFYGNYYSIPDAILNMQPYAITTAALAAVRTSAAMIGAVVFDTTADVQKYWNGSSWVPTGSGVYLPLAGGNMSGAIAMATNNITNIGTLSGAVNSRTADNIVSNAGASTSGNVATFADTTGKVITDSGASLSQYLPLAGGTMSGAIAMANHSITGADEITATTASTGSNPTANSLLIGGASIVNIRAANTTCDLGTTALPFRDFYLRTAYPSQPSAISIISSAVASNTFVSGTSKLIVDTGFAQLQNPHSDFTFTASTGQITYTGSVLKFFLVRIGYSHVGIPGNPSLQHYVSRNGSLVLATERTFITMSPGTTTYNPYAIGSITQLGNGDTIQLAGQLSANGSVNYQAIYYNITQL